MKTNLSASRLTRYDVDMNKPVVVITGATDGLGLAVAKHLQGMVQLVIIGRNVEKVHLVSKDVGGVGIVMDVRSPELIEKGCREIVQRFGKVDVLIQCAGIWRQGTLSEHTPDQVTDLFAVNTMGPILITRALLPVMQQQESGRLIFVLSRDAKTAKAARSVYHATKWALEGFIRCLRCDLQPYPLSITAVYPGLMKTNMFTKAHGERDTSVALDPEAVAEEIARLVWLAPEVEVAELAVDHRDEVAPVQC